MTLSVKYLPALALAALAVSAAPVAAATLIGDSISVKYYDDASGSYAENFTGGFPFTIVGAAGDSDLVKDSFPGGPFFSVDVEASSIIVTFLQTTWFTGHTFDGLVFSDFDSVIASFTPSGQSGVISQSGNSLSFNFVGKTYSPGETVVADLTFGPASVPLPAALPLLAGAIGGLAAIRRRKQA